MKKEVIIVPKDKCPLDVLADMGEKTNGVGILFSPTALGRLLSTVDRCYEVDYTAFFLSWNATAEFPKTSIILLGEPSDTPNVFQYRVIYINAEDICFKKQLDNRTMEYFLTMEE